MICSSVNRLGFMVHPFPGDGLYLLLEEFAGLRPSAGCAALGTSGSTDGLGSVGDNCAPAFRTATPVVECSACSVVLISGSRQRSRTCKYVTNTSSAATMIMIVAGTTLGGCW